MHLMTSTCYINCVLSMSRGSLWESRWEYAAPLDPFFSL
jgi:hypothetical protein